MNDQGQEGTSHDNGTTSPPRRKASITRNNDDVLTVATMRTRGDHNILLRDIIVEGCHVATQTPRDLVDKLLGRQTVLSGHISCALSIPEGIVQSLAQLRREGQNALGVGLRLGASWVGGEEEVSGVVHGTHECLHHTQRVHRGLFATLMSLPEICNGTVRGLELLDHGTVFALANEIRGDETGRAMHLLNANQFTHR